MNVLFCNPSRPQQQLNYLICKNSCILKVSSSHVDSQMRTGTQNSFLCQTLFIMSLMSNWSPKLRFKKLMGLPGPREIWALMEVQTHLVALWMHRGIVKHVFRMTHHLSESVRRVLPKTDLFTAFWNICLGIWTNCWQKDNRWDTELFTPEICCISVTCGSSDIFILSMQCQTTSKHQMQKNCSQLLLLVCLI